MPDKGRPPKHVRQLLAAQHAKHQEQTAGLLMASANVMAHAARALRPMDDEAVAQIVDKSEQAELDDDTGPKEPALADMVAMGELTCRKKSVRSVYQSLGRAGAAGKPSQ